MSMRFGRDAVMAVKTALVNNWASMAATINAKYADGINVIAPATWYTSRIGDQQVPSVPAVFVLSGPGEHRGMDIANNWETTRTVFVAILVEDPDPNTLQELIWRNKEVAGNILENWAVSGLDAQRYFVTGVRDAESGLFEKDNNYFTQDGVIEITLQSIEG